MLGVASNRAYLEQLIRRRGARARARAFPSGLPEWAWLDTTAAFWAPRHYRHDDVSEDPTSPLAKVRDGDHYLSQADDAEQIARRMWNRPGDGVTPAFRRVSKDAIEVRFTAKDEEDRPAAQPSSRRDSSVASRWLSEAT